MSFDRPRVKSYECDFSSCAAVSFNSNGSLLAALTKDGTVCLWKQSSSGLKQLSTLRDTSCKSAYHLAWNTKKPNIVAAVYGDNSGDYIRIWDVSTEECLQKVKPSASKEIISVTWSPDGKLLGFGTDVESFVLLDGQTGSEIGDHSFKPSQLDEFQWSANNQFVFTATKRRGKGTGNLTCARLTLQPNFKLTPVRSCGAYVGQAHALCVDKQRKRLAISASDSVVSIWSTKTMLSTATIDRFDQAPAALSFSGDGKYIACAFNHVGAEGSGTSKSAFIDIADTFTGKRVSLLKSQDHDEVAKVCWHPSEPMLAFCGTSRYVTVVTF